MLKVLGLGDSVVDEYMHIHTIYPGGNILSFVVYAEVFGMGADYLGVFGGDEAVVHVYDTIRDLGLGLPRCRFYPGENGYAGVRLNNRGKMLIGSNEDGVSREHPLELTVMGRAYIAGYNIVHTSIFSYIEDELPLIHQVSSFVSMDFSDRVDEEYLRQCAPYVDRAGISYDNMPRSEIEKQVTLIRKFRCRYIVIATRGAKRVLVMVDGCLYEQSPCLVEAVDAMGVGDSSITRLLVNYVDVMKDSRDFPSVSETKGIVIVADYQDLAVRTSLYRAAVYSAGNCQKEGSFGSGKVFQCG